MIFRHRISALGLAAMIFLGLMPSIGARAAVIMSGPVINPGNGHTYYLLSSDSWTASEAFAQSLGGHLVTINDAAENTWVSNTFTANGTINRAIWIGLTDSTSEGTWVWASGESVSYTAWDAGQPNSGLGQWEEDFAHLWGTTGYGGSRFKWNDYLDSSSLDGQAPLHGVIELASPIPEPAPLALFGAAVVAAFCSRRIRSEK